MAATESEIAAKLIERLLADPAFRDRFRRNPPAACREAGLESLAEEMRLGAGKAMHTLDIRESRSSLAGVMMAAAMEGMGIYEFSKHVVPHIEDLSGSLGDVLSRVNLPALPGAGALAGGPEPSAPGARAGGARRGRAARQRRARRRSRRRRPRPEAAAAAGAARQAATKPAAGARRRPRPSCAARRPKARRPRPASRDGGGRARAPELAGIEDAPAGAGRTRATRRRAGSSCPAPGASRSRRRAGRRAARSRPRPRLPPRRRGRRPPRDRRRRVRSTRRRSARTAPAASANAEARALLENPNVVFDDVGVADIKAGKIDPRIVGVLTKLSQEHKIVVSCMCSDHSKFTAGGSISNHAFGRGLDIASIDGEIVSPGSALAREVSSALSELDPAIRPDEIGSPFAINGPGYFTDAAHMNHIHVGFKQEISPDFKLPAELAAGGAAAGAAAAAPAAGGGRGAGGARSAGRAAADPKKQSGLFAAVPQPASVAAAEAKLGERQRLQPVPTGRQASRAARPRRRRTGAAAGAGPGRRPRRRADRVPGRQRAQGADRRVDGERGRETRAAAATSRHGGAGGVQPHQRQLRRRRLPRLLPDARLLLGPGRLRRLRRRPRQADRLVPRPGRSRQGPTRLPRPTDRRPQPVRRMDRRRRTPRRAIPRPLPAPSRRGQRAVEERARRAGTRGAGAGGEPAAPRAPPSASSAATKALRAQRERRAARRQRRLARGSPTSGRRRPAPRRGDGEAQPRSTRSRLSCASRPATTSSRRRLGVEPLRRPRHGHRHGRRRARGPGNAAAREVASASPSSQGDSGRTSRVAVGDHGAGVFTDAAHQNHIHVAFDGEVRRLRSASAPAPAAAAAGRGAAAPAAPEVAAAAPAGAAAGRPKKQSGLFAAVPQPASVAAAEAKPATAGATPTCSCRPSSPPSSPPASPQPRGRARRARRRGRSRRRAGRVPGR